MPAAPAWQRLGWYLAYRRHARSSQYIHSPFLFALMQQVFRDSACPAAASAEQYRQELVHSRQRIPVKDLGAGSQRHPTAERITGHIARASLQRPRYARFLYRLCQYLRVQTVLELGTSFGITTQYLALGAGPESRVFTLEGNPSSAAIAREGFIRSGLNNVQLTEGAFDEKLPELLSGLTQLDLVFLDGNHRLEPTLKYFRLVEPLLHKASVVVVDDIYWSAEMQQAWRELCAHDRVTLQIDMFQFGLLFFNTDLSREHFILRY